MHFQLPSPRSAEQQQCLHGARVACSLLLAVQSNNGIDASQTTKTGRATQQRQQSRHRRDPYHIGADSDNNNLPFPFLD
jgi:hypothetical protein